MPEQTPLRSTSVTDPHQTNEHPIAPAPLPPEGAMEATAGPEIEDYYYRLTEGEPVVGTATISWMIFGLLLGGTFGWIVGTRVGAGLSAIDGLAPMASGGAGVTGFVFACLCGAIVALTGAIFSTVREAKKYHRRAKHGRVAQAPHSSRSWVLHLPVAGAMVLAAITLFTLYIIAARGAGSGVASPQDNRITWHQKNVTRLGGTTTEETAFMVYQTAYPATRQQNRPSAAFEVPEDWRIALAMTPLIAASRNAVLVMPGEEGFTTAGRDELRRMGFTAAAVQHENETDPVRLAARLDRRYYDEIGLITSVIIVAADQDYRWALPAAAYAARTGVPVLFTLRDSLPAPTEAALRLRNGHARMFLLGPKKVISEDIARQLTPFGTVTRIAGKTPAELSVRFAEFRDERANFGWGHTGHGPRQYSSVNTILVNEDNWRDGILAAHLARRGKPGPILFTERDELPSIVDNHLWRQRPVYAGSPAEGPFNHIWIVGGLDRVSYAVQAWADYSQEIGQYMTQGDSAVSGYEALVIGWIILSLASATWVLIHSVTRMKNIMPFMRAAWVTCTLLLGPIALVLYIRNYHRRPTYEVDGMTMWERTRSGQTVSATVMMFGFDMLLMVLVVFALAYWGFPILRLDGPFFWIGSSMFLMMVLMYVIALGLMMIVFHTPMTMQHEHIPSYRQAFRIGLPVMVATMTAESLGMMPTMWWQQMTFLPGMQMPTGDDTLMWGTLLVAVLGGFLVALPFNHWMVRTGRKVGTM